MTGLLGLDLPVVAAPMAGGPTTPALVEAVAGAGAFGMLAAGYHSAAAMRAEIDAVRTAGAGDRFGVNLFVPARDASGAVERADPRALETYARRLSEDAEALGAALDPHPAADDDGWPSKLDDLVRDPVPVVSLTFGLPRSEEISMLRRVGTLVLASITTAAEARAAAEHGVDGLVVQGPRAGGHSATFDPSRVIGRQRTGDVVAAVAAAVGLPLIAGGGIAGPAEVAEVLGAGADAVVVGTALLLADEAGTSSTHRAALRDPRFTETTITRAFTGRPARGLRNDFTDRHEAAAPLGYPDVHHLTRPLRQEAARVGDAERLHLWAGTGYRSARSGPAAGILAALVEGV